MSLDNPKAGLGYAAEFQSSALPWVTSSTAPAAGSPVRYDFPKVTRFITVTNLNTGSSTLSFGFTRSGVTTTNNKYIVNPNQSITLETRVTQIHLQGESGTPTYNVFAGLTSVDAIEMPVLTGSLNGTTMWIGVG